MSLSIVNIAFLADGLKLVKDKASDNPIFSLRVLKDNQWVIVSQWNDPCQVANLLVQFGYESEHLPAIQLLNIL
ncbi:MAG: hypothetical protein HOM14_19335 [Gammaproteobacteria bacterium]|jgi:hypothetical protein|nr:hypothetical protein [Gammaproteobacteria bacterium]MBT3722566.1 hypothetical protein [Gammaproteobacteria bacterium]MBT4196995.1 hypothetical protein [Gammaproteobacteria bacterium]MBT4451850.1 hypothetical protein [Gammaproteobacteria bacterium]MBT4860761.1 hypothetical protein [Gammaproteobacteria bacterium]